MANIVDGGLLALMPALVRTSGYLSAADKRKMPRHLRPLVTAYDRLAWMLMQRAAAAARRGDRRTFLRLAVASVEATNCWRRILGWQLMALAEQTRAIAAGRAEPPSWPRIVPALPSSAS